jgi:hypothetical protein
MTFRLNPLAVRTGVRHCTGTTSTLEGQRVIPAQSPLAAVATRTLEL